MAKSRSAMLPPQSRSPRRDAIHWPSTQGVGPPSGAALATSIRIFRGEWVDGEREARLAGEESERFDLGHTGMALYEVGLVRLRTGDFDGAEDAFRRTMERGFSPQPGLALLQLARGDAAGASSSIKAA